MRTRRTEAEARLVVEERREALRRAGRCINGPLHSDVGRKGIEHGPPVRHGRCQHCDDVYVRTSKAKWRRVVVRGRIYRAAHEIAVAKSMTVSQLVEELLLTLHTKEIEDAMSKVQSRKSISISGKAFAAFRARCDVEGVSMASVIERFVRDVCDLEQVDHKSGESTVEPVRMTPQQRAMRDDIEAIKASLDRQKSFAAAVKVALKTPTPTVPVDPLTAAAQQRAKAATDRIVADEQRQRRRERAAEANPCRLECGVMALHEAGTCARARAEERAELEAMEGVA